jgi:CheY-like chemotaxis protein
LNYRFRLIVSANRCRYCYTMPKLASATRVSRFPERVPSNTHTPLFRTSRVGQCKSARPTLLWIDDFAPALALYKTMGENLGFRVLTASSGKAGLRLAASNRIDLVVTDYEMPEMNGEDVAMALKALSPRTPVLLFSGSSLVPQSTRRIVDACCDKAAPRNQLLRAIHGLLQRTDALQPPPVTHASDHGQRTVAQSQ